MLCLSDHQTMTKDQSMISKTTFIEIHVYISTTSGLSAGNLTEGMFNTQNHELGYCFFYTVISFDSLFLVGVS